MRTIAKRIKIIPTHWITITSSPNKTKAMVTETGNSSDEIMLPNPKPVFGNPKLNNMGGMMVPNKARTKP